MGKFYRRGRKERTERSQWKHARVRRCHAFRCIHSLKKTVSIRGNCGVAEPSRNVKSLIRGFLWLRREAARRAVHCVCGRVRNWLQQVSVAVAAHCFHDFSPTHLIAIFAEAWEVDFVRGGKDSCSHLELKKDDNTLSNSQRYSYLQTNYTVSKKTSPFYFSNQKLTDFNYFWCVKSWENLTSIACTCAHPTCIL